MATADNREQRPLIAPDGTSVILEGGSVSVPPGATICGVYFSKKQLLVAGVAFIIVSGLVLGFAVPPNSEDPHPWNKVSSIIGWWYFMAWSVSFLPQIFMNYTRKCVVGQSFDYVALNVLGFTCYSIYACGFFFSDAIQDQYQNRFHSKNNVDPNDVGFAVYALTMCLFNSWQIFVYDRGTQILHKLTVLGIALTIFAFAVWLVVLLAGVRSSVFFNTLDILYGLSIVKLGVSLIKYIPQIYLNYKRKLTIGWNIWNVLLDFTGGSLSVLQQLIDCGTTGHWNGIAGNPIKFCLGLMSMVYDVIFMVQHYCLYSKNNALVEASAHGSSSAKVQDSA